jgi:hypothetical protein
MVHRNLLRLYANIPAARIRAWQQREVSIAHLEAVVWLPFLGLCFCFAVWLWSLYW